jgi:tetratricopeptide (TPR) repeat protein
MQRGFLVAATLLWLTASAAQADDYQTCFSLGGENESYKNAGRFAEAEQACTRLIAVRTGIVLAATYACRGSWRHKQKNYDGALQDYDQAISINPKNVEFYDYRADTFLAKGNVDGAIATYDKAIGMDPTYAAARFSRGQAYATKGLIDQARADYQAVIALPAARASFGQKEDRIQQWAQQEAAKRLKKLDEQEAGK